MLLLLLLRLLRLLHDALLAVRYDTRWGDWRCNTLAFVGAVSVGRCALRLAPGEREAMLESAFFAALVGQGFGTISGERLANGLKKSAMSGRADHYFL